MKYIVDSMLDDRAISPKFEAPQLLVEKAADFLTDLIIEGQLKPGGPISEIDLNKRYGISRSPIREALRILEQRGLVTSIPRRGAYVKKLTKRDVQEIFPVRAILEGYAAKISVEKISAHDLKEFISAIDGMRESANGNDFKLFLKYHYKFHRVYIRASDNAYLITMLDRILNQAFWLHQAYEYFHRSFRYSINKHLEILDAFKNKSAQDAERLVVQHILAAVDPIADHLPEIADYGK